MMCMGIECTNSTQPLTGCTSVRVPVFLCVGLWALDTVLEFFGKEMFLRTRKKQTIKKQHNVEIGMSVQTVQTQAQGLF